MPLLIENANPKLLGLGFRLKGTLNPTDTLTPKAVNQKPIKPLTEDCRRRLEVWVFARLGRGVLVLHSLFKGSGFGVCGLGFGV